MRISATPMRKYAYQGGTFILYRFELSRLPISISDQTSLLKGGGLVIGDDTYTKEQLGIISNYKCPFVYRSVLCLPPYLFSE